MHFAVCAVGTGNVDTMTNPAAPPSSDDSESSLHLPQTDLPTFEPQDTGPFVKYRPEGWVVEAVVDGRFTQVSGPHAARGLAEAVARDWLP